MCLIISVDNTVPVLTKIMYFSFSLEPIPLFPKVLYLQQ